MIGREVLNYTIKSLIGKGGMGSVYLGEHKHIKQQKVAIKVINGNVINDFTRQRLAEEADRLARMNHPNIVHFINYHIDDNGTVYLIMEYADGRNLEDYIKNVSGLIVEDRICGIFEPLLDAFDYAHKHKVIHKDIKPSNIVITNEGVPKILDFGIAALLDEREQSAENGVIMGTPSYMSPEQVKGETLDPRSDIYSLGILLHHMMTGNAPYDTTTLSEHEIYKRVVEQNLPKMKTFYKFISEKVQRVVDKATSKKPEARYQSCAEFKKALHSAIYPAKVSKFVKIAVAAVVALLIAGSVFVWDYTRVKVYFYKDYVEQYGIPQGIGEISSSDSEHTHRMYRFEYKNYKLQRVSHVNSIGTIIPDGETERNDRPLDIRFYYNDDKLIRAKVYDHNGKVLFIKAYNENLHTVIFQYDDEYGTEKTLGSSTVGHVDPFAVNQSRGKISRYKLEYDKNGYVKTIRYAGFQNVDAHDVDGIYGKQYVRDSKGRVIEETYLGHDGEPKATQWGLGKKIHVYDSKDNWVKTIYQTIDGEAAMDTVGGTFVVENKYDKYGNITVQCFKTSEGNYMIADVYGCAGVKYEYDDKGYQKKMSYLGVDGNVDYIPSVGAAAQVYTCDKYGFFNSITYLDINGNPCVTSDGYASVKIVSDSKGNELERWTYDENKQLVITSGGFAGITAEYDSRGYMVKMMHHGADGELCEMNEGYAGIYYEYNANGDVIKYSCVGTDLEPTTGNDNVCTMVLDRDLNGNIVKVSFFDVENYSTLSSEGISVMKFKYDDNGNEVSRQFFDQDDNLTKGNLGYAQIERAYDENGGEASYRFYDENHNLVLVDGLAGRDYKRDNRGNVIEDMPVGLDNKLAKGYLLATKKYDDRDNNTEFAVFDANGKPDKNNNGIHKITYQYNSRNQIVETRYYNTKGELTKYDDDNYSIMRVEYNEKGQIVRVSYFDTNDQPALYYGDYDGGYASYTNEYDVYGRVSRQYYFDAAGNPTDPKVMVPEAVTEYDKWGNRIYVASCDGSGNLIHNSKTGWSYMRCEYDNQGNLLWDAYFNENEKAILCKNGYHKGVHTYILNNLLETSAYFNTNGDAMLCKEGYHKVLNTYTDTKLLESKSYYDVSGNPMLVNGYHKEVYKYNEYNNLIEIACYGKNGKLTNNSWGYAKRVYGYDSNQEWFDDKYYNASGTQIGHYQYVNGSWIEIRAWQNDIVQVSNELPYYFGEDYGNLVWKSAKVVGSSKAQLVFVAPESKYKLSNSEIEYYKSVVTDYVNFINGELPNYVAVEGILKDSKDREIAKISVK